MASKQEGNWVVGDSGVVSSPSNTTTVAEELTNSPTVEGQSSRPFAKIGEGVLFLKESSADEDNKKWPSGVPQSSGQQPVEANLNTSSASVDVERQPNASSQLSSTETAPPGEWRDQGTTLDSHHSAQASTPAVDNPTADDRSARHSIGQVDSRPPGAWKGQVPTLDSYQPALASPTSPSNLPDSTTTDEGGAQASFTVGRPDSLPHEEENVESSSELIVEKSEMSITGDAKKDKEKILSLEAKLRKTEAKVNDLKRELAKTIKMKEQSEKELEKANKRIEEVKAEGERANAVMQKKYEAEISDLKERIASAEQQKSDLREDLCKQIKDLCNQLKKETDKHNEEVFKLMKDKHLLELTVEKMNTNEERLKRELSEANLEATKLRNKLELQERDKQISVLRSESVNALQKKEDELNQKMNAELEKLRQQKDAELEELKQQFLTQMSMGSTSSQGSGTEGKGEP